MCKLISNNKNQLIFNNMYFFLLIDFAIPLFFEKILSEAKRNQSTKP